MSYKREQFIENLDDILQDIDEIFILDRSGYVPELNDGVNLSRPIASWLFRNYDNEWKMWRRCNDSTISGIEEFQDSMAGEKCTAHLSSSLPIKTLILRLLGNRKNLSDIVIEIDGQMVID